MRVAFLTFVLLSFSPWAAGQHDCPEGFSYVNTLSGTGSESNPFDKRLAVKFPENATLDESFQQKKVRATNGKSGAQSALRAQDIPKGVLIIPYGKSDEIYRQGWAVSDPELKGIEQDANRKVLWIQNRV